MPHVFIRSFTVTFGVEEEFKIRDDWQICSFRVDSQETSFLGIPSHPSEKSQHLKIPKHDFSFWFG